MKSPYEPIAPAKFWCQVCDAVSVDSQDKSTGAFFLQFGHSFDQETRTYEGVYTGVMYALCNKCLEKPSNNI